MPKPKRARKGGRLHRFSPAWIESLAPRERLQEWQDIETKGLVLRLFPAGAKSFAVRYTVDGRQRRHTLGDFPSLTLAQARKLALRARGKAAEGTDPQKVREAAREAERRRRIGAKVGAAIDSWLADQKLGPAARWKGGLETGGTWALGHVRRLKRTLGETPLAELSARQVEAFVSEPAAAATRNKALGVVRLFVAWARRKGLLETDPTTGLRKERETERTRTLTDAELRALLKGFDETRLGPAVRLLAYTGLRREEVLGAEWEWLDLEAGEMTIPPEAEKSGRTRGEPRRVALSGAAVELLKLQRKANLAEGFRAAPFVFLTSTGERHHKDATKQVLYRLRGLRSNGRPASTDKRAKPRKAVLGEDVTIHDLRRTVADGMLRRLNVSPWIVDHVVLGHARPKLLRTYMPTLPLDETRDALNRWAALVAEIVDKAKAEAEHA